MDVVEFEYKPFKNGSYSSAHIQIWVNGQKLQALAKSVEQPCADAEGNPKLAGDYQPLALWDINDDRSHFLGRPVARWFEDGDTVLMGCPCGEWGCWPLTVDVAVTDTSVHWRHFRNGHREWDLSALGPFEFDRLAYERALNADAAV